MRVPNLSQMIQEAERNNSYIPIRNACLHRVYAHISSSRFIDSPQIASSELRATIQIALESGYGCRYDIGNEIHGEVMEAYFKRFKPFEHQIGNTLNAHTLYFAIKDILEAIVL